MDRGRLRCRRCGRELWVHARLAGKTGLCRECQRLEKVRYRAATSSEREVLDEARRKLVVAFVRGDELTWGLCCGAIGRVLRGMRQEDD
jgi:hypothetical protein